jgi:hypothetical protein
MQNAESKNISPASPISQKRHQGKDFLLQAILGTSDAPKTAIQLPIKNTIKAGKQRMKRGKTLSSGFIVAVRIRTATNSELQPYF